MLRIIITICCLVGAVFSYFTVSDAINWQVVGDNYVSTCQINSFFDCRTVADSEYSSFLGFPNGVWGIVFFGLLFLTAIVADKRRVAFALSLVGTLTSISMFVIALAVVGAMCLWCCGLYLCSLLLTILCYLLMRKTDDESDARGDEEGFVHELISFVTGSGISIYRFGGFIVGAVLLCGFALTLPEELKKRVSYQDSPEIYLREQLAKWRDGKQVVLPEAKLRVVSSEAQAVTIHEFFDFQCPACQMMYRKLGELKAKYPLIINYLNYPLSNKCNDNLQGDFHQNACEYAKLALCARSLGADVDKVMETLLFIKKDAQGEGPILALLGQSRSAELRKCVDSPAVAEELNREISLTKKFEMTGTPTLLVNGRLAKVSDVAVLEEIIKEAMKGE